jgi:glycosyltransferase involved in cell wall biosynthesis
MRVVHLNTYTGGGAFRGSFRLHMGLRALGVDSLMLTRERTDNPDLLSIKGLGNRLAFMLASRMEQRALAAYPQRQKGAVWSINSIPDGIASVVNGLKVDVVHCHWIGAGFVPLGAFSRFTSPVVWTLRDWWTITGGCHLPQDCTRYQDRCGACPQLGSQDENDLSRRTWEHKQQYWQHANFKLVALSRGLSDCARASGLFRDRPVEVIPNGLDLTIYRPIDRAAARTVLGLPRDRPLVAFGAMFNTSDYNKGFHLLQPALQQLASTRQDTELVVFGATSARHAADFNMPIHFLGTLRDDLTLALAYSAADVFVSPSLQENLPNTVLEALACATPCVAFRIGGQPDLIDHRQNGYLAEPYEVNDLAAGIRWVLEDRERWTRLSQAARQKVEREFEISLIARRYKRLYEELVSG